MIKKKRTLSSDDRKAVDVILDHISHAEKANAVRYAAGASPSRINAATRLLSMLNELPPVDPPKNLVAKTMERISQQSPRNAAHRANATKSSSAHLH